MKLHTKILLGLGAGAFVGAMANIFLPGDEVVTWIAENLAKPVGDIFLRMLLMTVIPLVFSSITLGVAGLGDIRRLGRVGAKTLSYFVLSTALSATVGLVLVNLIRPGDGLDPAVRQRLFDEYQDDAAGMRSGMATSGSWISLLVNIVPRNPVQAAANLDMLGVIFFAIVFGAALTLVPEDKSRPMIRVLDAVGEAIVKVIDFAMALAPYGVFGLIFFTVYRFGWEILLDLAKYVAVVLAGLLLYASVGLSLLVRIFGKLNPWVFWKKAWTSLITGFSTSSSNATLPTNIAVAERELGIPPKIAGFVLPLGATMNMNGTALYEGVTVLFLAQAFGVELALQQQLLVVLLAVLTAIGAAGVPGGSLPLIMVVLASVGVPPEAIAIILGVDRILDMSRTSLNVTGDLTAAVYIARTEAGWRPEVVDPGRAPPGAGA